jgi:hypothetical protein
MLAGQRQYSIFPCACTDAQLCRLRFGAPCSFPDVHFTQEPVCPFGVATETHEPERPSFRVTRPSLITAIKATTITAQTRTPFILVRIGT